MAFFTFVGTGTITGEFTIDDIIVTAPLVRGEYRLQKAFPYPALETWRRYVLTATASIPAWDTRGRTTVLFAHEADLGAMFLGLTKIDPELLSGHYNYKRKALLVDKDIALVMPRKTEALRELEQQRLPKNHIELIKQRLDSETFNHRVAGMCGAVYFTALLLEDAEAIA